MSRFQVVLHVEPRPGVLDPQGAATRRALDQLGFDSVRALRVGKEIRLEVEASDPDAARREVEAMVRALLVNPSTESYRLEVAEASEDRPTAGGQGMQDSREEQAG